MNDVYEQITKDANFKAVKENGNNCYLLDYARHRLPRVLFGVTSSKDVERTPDSPLLSRGVASSLLYNHCGVFTLGY